MAGCVQILAVAVLLAFQASATNCVEGSCLEDVTSLVQVQRIVTRSVPAPKTVQDEVGHIVQELRREDGEGTPGMHDRVKKRIAAEERGVEKKTEDSPAEGPGVMRAMDENPVFSNPMDKAIRNDARMIANDINNNIAGDRLGRSVLPPPVGHGEVEPNPDIVTDRAVDSKVPGGRDGTVIEAFDNGLANARQVMKEASPYHRNQEFYRGMRDLNRRVENRMQDQNKALEEAMQENREEEQKTLASRRNTEQEAIDQVADEEQALEEADIVKAQTSAAAVEGEMYGARLGEQDAEESARKEANDDVNRMEAEQRHSMKVAREEAERLGITQRQRMERAAVLDADALLHSRQKELDAIEAQDDRNKALVDGDMVGAEHLKEHMIRQQGNRNAEKLRNMAENAREDTDMAVHEGVPAVVDAMVADTVNGMGPIAQGAYAEAIVNNDLP